MGMTDRNIYQLGEHKFERTDSKGREEEWSWVVTPETVMALQEYHLQAINNK